MLASIRDTVVVAVIKDLALIGNSIFVAVDFAGIRNTVLIAVGITLVWDAVQVAIGTETRIKIALIRHKVPVAVVVIFAFIGMSIPVAVRKLLTSIGNTVKIAVWKQSTRLFNARAVSQPTSAKFTTFLRKLILETQRSTNGAGQTATPGGITNDLTLPTIIFDTLEFSTKTRAQGRRDIHAVTVWQTATTRISPSR